MKEKIVIKPTHSFEVPNLHRVLVETTAQILSLWKEACDDAIFYIYDSILIVYLLRCVWIHSDIPHGDIPDHKITLQMGINAIKLIKYVFAYIPIIATFRLGCIGNLSSGWRQPSMLVHYRLCQNISKGYILNSLSHWPIQHVCFINLYY